MNITIDGHNTSATFDEFCRQLFAALMCAGCGRRPRDVGELRLYPPPVLPGVPDRHDGGLFCGTCAVRKAVADTGGAPTAGQQ